MVDFKGRLNECSIMAWQLLSLWSYMLGKVGPDPADWLQLINE